jgi:hypothetical protein
MIVTGLIITSERFEEKQGNSFIHIRFFILALEIVMVAVFRHVHWHLKELSIVQQTVFTCFVAIISLTALIG